MEKGYHVMEQYEDALFAVLMERVLAEEGSLAVAEQARLRADPGSAAADRTFQLRCEKTIRKTLRRRKRTKLYLSGLLSVLVLVLTAVFLTGCGEETASPPPLLVPSTEYYGENWYVLSLEPDQTHAVLSGRVNRNILAGEDVTLSAPPFQDETGFYFPLKDVAELLGGSCSLFAQTATVELFGQTILYEEGIKAVTIDGISYPTNTASAPVIRDGVFYIPTHFNGDSLHHTGLDWTIPVYGSDDCNVTFLSCGNGYGAELGFGGVYLNQPYEELPQAFRNTFTSLGFVQLPESYPPYHVEHYTSRDMDLYVMRAQDPQNDPDLMDGRIASIQVLTDRFSSVRGLRVGDTKERMIFLYGNSHDPGWNFTGFHFHAPFNHGVVTSMTLCTHYWCAC